MTAMELLEMLGEVKEQYILEAHEEERQYKRMRPIKRSLLIAAIVVAMMLAMVGCALVAMRLKDMKIEKPIHNSTQDEPTVEDITDELSLQGFAGSANYKAVCEWNEFLNSYDTDGKLLESSDSDDYPDSMEYMSYVCYTQEMQNKIDEICSKYNLEILGPVYTGDYAIDAVKAVGVESIFADTAKASTVLYSGYYYRGGTFALDGETTLNYEGSPWSYPIDYQYRCVMKNAFDGVVLTVGDIESYDEWNYTLEDGTKVLLALSTEKALLIADKKDYFVTINILNPYTIDDINGIQYMGKDALEAFAETFTFDYVPTSPDPDSLVAPDWFTDIIDYSCSYADMQGTDEIYSELTMELWEGCVYNVSIGLHRLALLEGIATEDMGAVSEEEVAEGLTGFVFADEELGVKGIITLGDKGATFTITESAFEYLVPGEKYEFLTKVSLED